MRRSERFGRIPKNVLTDRDLSDRAVRIYGLLAMTVFQGNVARVGIRLLAEQAACSRASAHRALKELVLAGHLTTSPVGAGERAWYMLHSSIFAGKQRALDAGETTVEELVSVPRRRLATVRRAS